MKASQVLRKARALCARGWTQGSYATDAAGNEVQLDSPEAVSFCMAGAIDRASGIFGAAPDAYDNRNRAEGYLSVVLPDDGYIGWQDACGRTKREVLDVFTEARLKAEAAGD